jgi:hypothetical protein
MTDPTPEVEFFVGKPKKKETKPEEDQPTKAVSSPAEPAPPKKKKPAPALEIDIGETKKLIAEVTQAETQMIARAQADPEDPSVLLQGLLGNLPGVDAARSADMALNTDIALHNLGVKAKRMHRTEAREERRQTPGAGPRAGKKNKKRRQR